MSKSKKEERFLLEGQYDRLFDSFGINVEEALRKAKIPEDIFNRRVPSVTKEQYFCFMNAVADSVSDPSLPVKIASSDNVEYFSPPIFAAYCSKDARTCIERISKYKRLIGPLRYNTERINDTFSIEITAGDDIVLPQFLAEMEIVFLLHIIRTATKEHVVPVHIMMQEPVSEKAFVDFAGIRAEAGSKNILVLSENDMNLPFITKNDMMLSYFEPELRRRLYDLEPEDTISTRLRVILTELLPGGSCKVDDAAGRLGFSRRTLQRRLSEEGTTFQCELDKIRERLAEHYLRNTNLTTESIAYLLGYKELNSFRKAFTSWTGLKVSEYRKTIRKH